MYGASFWCRMAFGRRGSGAVTLGGALALRLVEPAMRPRLHVGLTHEVERAVLGLEVRLREVPAHDPQA